LQCQAEVSFETGAEKCGIGFTSAFLLLISNLIL
jgi:hypothetical protein